MCFIERIFLKILFINRETKILLKIYEKGIEKVKNEFSMEKFFMTSRNLKELLK